MKLQLSLPLPDHRRLARALLLGMSLSFFTAGSGHGQTTSTWVAPIPADNLPINWTSTQAWSTAPVFPQNGQPAVGNTYQAVVGRVAGAVRGPDIRMNTDITLSGFEFSDGIISAFFNTPPDVLTVNGLFTWTGGRLEQAGETLANGGIVIGTNAVGTPTTIGDHGLTNAAGQTATHTAGTLYFLDSGMILADGGTFQNNGQFVVNGGAGIQDPSDNDMENKFRNAGNFTILATPTNTYTANVNFLNSGTVNVNSGTLALLHGGTSTAGIFNVPNGTTLQFRGPHTFDAATVFSGVGTIQFGGPGPVLSLPHLFTIASDYDFQGHTIITSPSITTFAGSATTGQLTFADGDINMPTNATLTVNGVLTLVDGDIASGGRILAAGGTLIANTAFMRFDNIQFTNPIGQTARIEGSGTLRLGNGSSLVNNGTFEAAGFGQVNTSGSSNRFVNHGTLLRVTNTSTFFISAPLTNRGTVSVQTGILQLRDVNSVGGSFAASAGAELDLQGNCTFDSATSFGGMGTMEFSSGNFAINGPYTVQGTTLVRFGSPTFLGNSTAGSFYIAGGITSFQGPANITSLTHSNGICSFVGQAIIGTLNQVGSDFNNNILAFSNSVTLNTVFAKYGGTLTIASNRTLTLNGPFDFNNGVINGGGVVIANGGMNLPAIEKDLDGATLINPAGRTVSCDGTTAGNLNFLNGAIFDNQGTFLARNNRFLNEFTGGGFFKNSGTFTRDTASGTFTVETDFENSGTVTVTTGRLTFASSSNFRQTGGTFRMNGGNVTKTGAAMLFEGGTFTGSGTNTGAVTMQGGTLSPGQSAGALIITGNLILGSNATFAVEIGGTNQGSQYDIVSEAGNAALTLNGTLAVSFINGFESSVLPTDTFTILTSSANLLGRFLNATNGARLNTTDGLGSFLVIYGTNSSKNVVLSNFVANAALPRITGISLTGPNVTLSWNPFGNITSYQVLSRTSLASDSWSSLLSVTGGTTEATFPRPTGANRFFRIVSP